MDTTGNGTITTKGKKIEMTENKQTCVNLLKGYL
jgi:hypothetical protein